MPAVPIRGVLVRDPAGKFNARYGSGARTEAPPTPERSSTLASLPSFQQGETEPSTSRHLSDLAAV